MGEAFLTGFGAGTARKVKHKLTAGSKTYDGSEAVTLTAADLGISSNVKVDYGNYIGTGKTNSSTFSLTFAFKPSLIFIGSSSTQFNFPPIILIQGVSRYSFRGSEYFDITWTNNSVSWTHGGGFNGTLVYDALGVTYYYVAIA